MNSFDIFLQFFIYIIIIINLFIIIQISLSRIFKLEKNISLVTEYKFLRNERLRIISEMSEYVRRKNLLSHFLSFHFRTKKKKKKKKIDPISLACNQAVAGHEVCSSISHRYPTWTAKESQSSSRIDPLYSSNQGIKR